MNQNVQRIPGWQRFRVRSLSFLCLLSDLVDFLLSKEAQPNVQDRQGRTPAMLAAELGNDAVLSLLTHKQADLTLRDAKGQGGQLEGSPCHILTKT